MTAMSTDVCAVDTKSGSYNNTNRSMLVAEGKLLKWLAFSYVEKLITNW